MDNERGEGIRCSPCMNMGKNIVSMSVSLSTTCRMRRTITIVARLISLRTVDDEARGLICASASSSSGAPDCGEAAACRGKHQILLFFFLLQSSMPAALEVVPRRWWSVGSYLVVSPFTESTIANRDLAVGSLIFADINYFHSIRRGIGQMRDDGNDATLMLNASKRALKRAILIGRHRTNSRGRLKNCTDRGQTVLEMYTIIYGY